MSSNNFKLNYKPSSKELKVLSAVLVILTAILLSCIVLFRPTWGPMDDVQHIYKTLPDIEKVGLWKASWNYAIQDLGWGMFRPLYPIMVFLLYKPAQLSEPWVLFFINAVFSFGLLYFLSRLFERIISVHRIFILLTFSSYFYLYDLFQHPSLQEKLVHGVGGLLLWFCLERHKNPKHWFLIFGVFALGLGTKASILIYYSMAVWILFSFQARATLLKRVLQSVPMLVPLLIALYFFAYISSKGGYTSGNFSLNKIVPNLLSPMGIFLLFPTLLGWSFLAVDLNKGNKTLLPYAPLVGVSAFLVLFLPWGISTYIQTMVAPFFCASVILLCTKFFHWNYRWIWVGPFVVLALAVGIYRPFAIFLRLSDMRHFLAFAQELPTRGVNEILVPCMEGADSLQTLLREEAKVSVSILRNEGPLPPPEALNGKWIFFDRGLCPLPNRALAPEGCAAIDTLFEGAMPKSYRLVKFSCK